MDEFGKRPEAGRDKVRTEGEADVERTDKELRKLLAPLATKPLLTKEEEDAALDRIRAAIDNKAKTKGQKLIP